MQKYDKQDVVTFKKDQLQTTNKDEITIVLSKEEALDTIRLLEGVKRRIQIILNK